MKLATTRIPRFWRKQQGFTLIELMIALFIASLLIVGSSMAFAQTMKITAASQDHMLLVRQLQTAGYWVDRDSLMSKDAVWQAPADPLPWQLTLSWEDVTQAYQYKSVYTINEQSEFVREYYINDVLQNTIVIATDIISDPAQTYYDTTVAYGADFRITAEIGGIVESRDYNILSRLYVP